VDANIRVNSARETELEFEVNIQGISVEEPENAAQVRFVITDVHKGDLSFKCERRADSSTKWYVKLAPLSFLSQSSNAHAFRIEVVIDGYYFEPATGNLIVLKDPEVTLQKASKPQVTAKIEQPNKDKSEPVETKEKEGPIEQKKDEKNVEETTGGGGVQIDQQPAPTNQFTRPEFPPDHDVEGDERMKSDHRDMPEDEDTDEEKLDDVVRETFGKQKKPEKPGFLFQRTTEGKPVITGLEPDLPTKRRLEEKAAAVRKALSESQGS